MKTQFDPDYGETKFPEFYYVEVADRNRIPVIIDWKNDEEDKVSTTLPSIGKAYENVDGSNAIEYAIFFVGNRKQIELYSKKINKVDIVEMMNSTIKDATSK
ncbi:hypothetical protein JHJ32_21070 [Parapedobacter sp. ISTM3]|uniref:hypothetical protein n=1 Tax=Parapedobacter sp. ISTM3 TaxID=2800130 RepID=UPI00190307D1|nr:hypothetical protein [Parapedobacter sp. ISTM3]MBK1442504.1 hypothetical protein [Parapedobacter sp. ISTM3]